MTYWAQSDPWQPLNEHLRRVGAIAEELAKKARPGDRDFHSNAKADGLLHDLGKYTEKFQKKINGETVHAPHSAHGAAKARSAGSLEAAFAIAGHHAGLPNPQVGRASLRERT